MEYVNNVDFVSSTGMMVVIIIAMVQVLKRSKMLNNRFMGLLAVLIGVILGLYQGSWFMGMIYGLMASGAWSTAKSTFFKNNRS